jgi:hypothetical protein
MVPFYKSSVRSGGVGAGYGICIQEVTLGADGLMEFEHQAQRERWNKGRAGLTE